MKKFISLVVVLFALLFSGDLQTYVTEMPKLKIESKVYDEVLVEYVRINDQWYKITHYPDGSISVEPVARPPLL